MTKPSCFRTVIKTGKGSKDDSGSQHCIVKKMQQPVNLNKKRLKLLRCKPTETLCMPLTVSDSFLTRRFTRICGYIHYMYYVLTLSYYDSCNRQQCTLAQIMFQRKLTISTDHITRTTAYSREKEHKGRERNQERNEREAERKKPRRHQRNVKLLN